MQTGSARHLTPQAERARPDPAEHQEPRRGQQKARVGAIRPGPSRSPLSDSNRRPTHYKLSDLVPWSSMAVRRSPVSAGHQPQRTEGHSLGRPWIQRQARPQLRPTVRANVAPGDHRRTGRSLAGAQRSLAASTASCGCCASSPWLPSPCAARPRTRTRSPGASRNERCRSPQGCGTPYRLWCERRTWTEMPLPAFHESTNSRPRAGFHGAPHEGRRIRETRKHTWDHPCRPLRWVGGGWCAKL